MTAPTSLAHAFQSTAAANPQAVALRTPDDATSITWAQYARRVEQLATGLAALGVKRGDTVALMMANRPEFHLVDTAVLHLGATPFSVYNTLPPEEIAYLFSNAGNRVVVADAAHLERVLAAGGAEHVVHVEGPADGATHSLEELAQLPAPAGFDFAETWQGVTGEDVLTLIYTSGTTGPPKGVELTHANMLAQCAAVAELLPIEAGDTITSYLPAAHIADRWSSHYNSLVYGIQITDVDDPRAVATVLPQLRPTLWGGVPRVLEKIKAALEAGIGADPDEARRAATQGAIAVGVQKVRLEQAGEAIPDELAAQHAAAEEHVLSKLRAKLGLDRVKWICVGAAPLSPEVHEFLLGLGLPVVELYGMSECSCVVTTITPEEVRVGTVGRPISAVELKLAEDGEMLVRGATVMRGYRGQPEKTAEALDADGWLATGDIVEIDADGYVKIVDR
jgi:long-subunit acyl-CoA synthetase (AMP-forming)